MRKKDKQDIFWFSLCSIAVPLAGFAGLLYVAYPLVGADTENTHYDFSSPEEHSSLFLPHTGVSLVERDWSVATHDFAATAIIATHSTTGQVLYSKNPDSVRPIASLTKLMVAIVVRENLHLYDSFEVSEAVLSAEGKKIGLQPGTSIMVRDALYALLLESGNDAAIALEEHYNERFPRFDTSSLVYDMNQRARSFGLRTTHFVDATGISPDNISTVYEITKLLKYASEDPILHRIMGTAEYRYLDSEWETTNALLHNEPGIIGGKTGYTEAAGQSISLHGTVNNNEVLMVILDARTDRILEGARLWQWIQQAYKW